jgi:hypothetical protein
VVQRQYSNGGGEADAPRASRHIGQNQIWAGQYAERAEVMLTDPSGMKPDLLGVDRLVEDIGHELVGPSPVVVVMVVAEGEITEFHLHLPKPTATCNHKWYQ